MDVILKNKVVTSTQLHLVLFSYVVHHGVYPVVFYCDLICTAHSMRDIPRVLSSGRPSQQSNGHPTEREPTL